MLDGFLPTPSARRATAKSYSPAVGDVISTHALREEGDGVGQPRQYAGRISTHALREEGDKKASFAPSPPAAFLPTPSARRATCGYHPHRSHR